MIHTYKMLVWKHKGKRPFRRLRHTWKDNIKTNPRDTGFGGVDQINVAQNRDWWRTPVRIVMNLGIP
jgi:hypothetical protein